MISSETQEEFFAASALDCLDAEDAAHLQALLERQPAKTSELVSFQRTASLLGLSVPAVAPDPALKERVFGEIERISRRRLPVIMNRSAPSAAAPRFTFDSLLPWAAVVLLALTSAWLWLQNTRARADFARLRDSVLQPNSLHASVLWGDSTRPQTRAELIFCTRLQQGKLVVHGLESPPPDHVYQVWLQTDSAAAPVSAGVFRIGPGGEGEIILRPAVKVKKLCKVLISLEKAGGVPKAEGPVVLAGNVM